MMTEWSTLSVTNHINATPAAVYHAFTNALALRSWLCDRSQSDPREGGCIYLWWDTGYYAAGIFTDLEPDHAVSFTWFGRDEPDPTNVRITLQAIDGGTQVVLEHTGVGEGAAWEETRKELEKGWQIAFENLQSVLETGQDLRVIRRPLFGMVPGGTLDEEHARRLGVPVSTGIIIDAVLEGMGAEAAGVQAGDILVELDGIEIDSFIPFRQVMDRHYAGDELELAIYRGVERIPLKIKLSSRPFPDVPDEPEEFARLLEEQYRPATDQLEALFKGVSEAAAEATPAPGEWSAKEVLAHLIATERDNHIWISSELSGRETGYSSDTEVRIRSIVSVYPGVQDLLADLKRSQAETVAMLAALPEEFVRERKAGYLNLGWNLLGFHYHLDNHITQIRSALGASVSG